MSPLVHNRIFPEIESANLLFHELRILVDPKSVNQKSLSKIIEMDVLRCYLKDVSGSSCRISFLLPAQIGSNFEAEYTFLQQLGAEVLPTSKIILPQVAEVFSDLNEKETEHADIASAAVVGDADIVVQDEGTANKVSEHYKKISISVEDYDRAKRSCEIFVRGHEIPWSFISPMWGCPWTTFYAMTELANFPALTDLLSLGQSKKLDSETCEHIRSLVLNRFSNLSYTRDKLLFYVQQRRTAKRHNLSRQDYSFEVGYFLNHYYLLFWGGLDQVCWIVNGIFNLGFRSKDWRKVGITNKNFLNKLDERAPEIKEIFTQEEFLKWVKLLRELRHHVAHKGVAMPAKLFFETSSEIPDDELDKEIEATKQWQRMKRLFPQKILETFRPTLRVKKRLEKYESFQELVTKIEIEGKSGLIAPLVNIDWDFENYMRFVLNVANKCVEHLRRA